MRIVYSGAMDLILALFPWTIVMKLRMTRSEKLGVAFAMSMGVLWVALFHILLASG